MRQLHIFHTCICNINLFLKSPCTTVDIAEDVGDRAEDIGVHESSADEHNDVDVK